MHKLSVLLFSAVAFFIFGGVPAFADELTAPATGFSESSLSVQDEAEPHYLDADEAFIPELEQNEQDVSIKFTIAPEYYLYQERFTITPINCEISDIIIPEGLYHDDEYMGPSHIYHDAVTVKLKVSRTDPFPKISIKYQGCTAGMCYPPITKKIAIDRLTADETAVAGSAGAAPKSEEDAAAKSTDLKSEETVEKIPGSDFTSLLDISNDSGSIYKMMGSSILFGLIAFFCFGVLLSLTPCMFPMYPIWSSIILGSRQKNTKTTAAYTFVYILGMAVAYMLAGFGIAYAGARFQMFLQQPAVLIIMSIIFLILAISMFGLFEMTLPSSWINRLQQFNDKQKGGTVTGVFLMGVISAVIASPCTTAPLAGALMFIMKDGDMIRGGAYLFVMGLGMGVPLAIIALLGQKFLPKSGMWMKNIKVLCGFIMLTIPLYLLRAYLSTEIITAIAILMSGSLICYLTLLVMKKQRGPFAIFTMTVTAAMATASLFMTPDDGSDNLFEQVKTLDELESVIRDNDVVIVDIRADWCASCKKYEDTTFADRNVIEYMSGFKNVYVDITEDNAPSKDIIEKYNSAITGAPTVLIFKNHTLISSVNGYLPAGSFMARINSALKKDR